MQHVTGQWEHHGIDVMADDMFLTPTHMYDNNNGMYFRREYLYWWCTSSVVDECAKGACPLNVLVLSVNS